MSFAGQALWHARSSLHLWCPHLKCYLLSNSLCELSWKIRRRWSEHLGSCYPRGQSKENSRLLSFAWFSRSYCNLWDVNQFKERPLLSIGSLSKYAPPPTSRAKLGQSQESRTHSESPEWITRTQPFQPSFTDWNQRRQKLNLGITIWDTEFSSGTLVAVLNACPSHSLSFMKPLLSWTNYQPRTAISW